MKFKDLKIGVQLTLGFAVMLLLVIILSVVSFKQNEQLHKQVEILYNHPFKTREAIGNLKVNILTMRLATRDLMLATNENERIMAHQQLEEAKAGVETEFDILEGAYLGPKKDISDAYKAFLNWNTARQENLKAIENGNIEKVKESVGSNGSVGALREEMLSKINAISAFAKTKADTLYLTSVKVKSQLVSQLWLITAIFIIISLFIIYYLLRSVRSPIKQLTDVIAKFKNGDLNVHSNISLKNEFGILSNTYNELIDQINEDMELSREITELSDSMLVEDNAHTFFMELLPVFSNLTNSQLAAIYLFNEEQEKFVLYESIGMMSELKNLSFNPNSHEGQFGKVLITKKIERILDIPLDTNFTFQTVSGTMIPREIISIPILVGEDVVAIITLASIRQYSDMSIRLINKTYDVLTARVDGILAYRKLRKTAKMLEHQKEELVKANSELEMQKTELATQSFELMQQNSELESQKKKLDEVSRLKTNFLSNMSHELRTPLNSVIALSGVLNRRLKTLIPDDEYSYIEVIERNGKHLLSLINDILDISRIEAGREEIDVEKFDAIDLVSDIVYMIDPQVTQKGIKLLFSHPDEKIILKNDSKKIRHIVQNLISNAVKFTEKGKVDVYLQQDSNYLFIKITDTGIGISEENLIHIFDEFRQADGSTSRRFGGTGLGLAIAKKYALLLGGNIDVSSEINKGSTFILKLPLNYNNSQEDIVDEVEFRNHPELAQNKTVFGHGKRILLVEDSEPAVIQIKDFLEQEGYVMQVADSGSKALEIVAEINPDGIILDLMMPGVDGFEVLQTIREAESTAKIPVLILSAKHITKDELKFLKHNNIYQLIQKGDVNKVALITAINNMVNRQLPSMPLSNDNKISPHIIDKPVVLVVEDNVDNMITVKAILGNNYSVIEAVDGVEGVDKAKAYKPDLILMDIGLPLMDGISVFKTIRSDVNLKSIPIIALTAGVMTNDRDVVLDHGFDAYLLKPIDESIFFKTINEVLYGK